jgi:hypothetical protein
MKVVKFGEHQNHQGKFIPQEVQYMVNSPSQGSSVVRRQPVFTKSKGVSRPKRTNKHSSAQFSNTISGGSQANLTPSTTA